MQWVPTTFRRLPSMPTWGADGGEWLALDGGAGSDSATVDPTGKFAYVANVTSNNVSAFTINASTGALTAVSGSPFSTGGTGSVSVTLDLSGRFAFVANNGSNNVSAFTIDASTGALAAVGLPVPAGATPISVITTGKIQ